MKVPARTRISQVFGLGAGQSFPSKQTRHQLASSNFWRPSDPEAALKRHRARTAEQTPLACQSLGSIKRVNAIQRIETGLTSSADDDPEEVEVVAPDQAGRPVCDPSESVGVLYPPATAPFRCRERVRWDGRCSPTPWV